MSWFKLDDQGAFHAKVVAAGNEAYGAWCRAGQWSSAQLTDGFIPADIAALIAPEKVWQRAAKARLVDAVDGGWQIHDYLDWNPSAETVREQRRKDSERKAAGRANQVREESGRMSSRTPSGIHTASGQDSAGPVPTRPDLTKQKPPPHVEAYRGGEESDTGHHSETTVTRLRTRTGSGGGSSR
jgi:hypothetical protein